ncbi:hypothetical protein D3C87_1904030 [compost metagenome]
MRGRDHETRFRERHAQIDEFLMIRRDKAAAREINDRRLQLVGPGDQQRHFELGNGTNLLDLRKNHAADLIDLALRLFHANHLRTLRVARKRGLIFSLGKIAGHYGCSQK